LTSKQIATETKLVGIDYTLGQIENGKKIFSLCNSNKKVLFYLKTSHTENKLD